jgi:zinc protease
MVKSTYPAEHPYAHTIIGSMEDLDSATLDDVREWFKTYYTPSNAVLALAGDITAAEARERVTRYFGEIDPGPPVAHQRAWIAKMRGEHRETVQDRVPQARVYKTWNVPGYGTAAADYLLGFTSGWSMTIKSPPTWARIWTSARLAANSF